MKKLRKLACEPRRTYAECRPEAHLAIGLHIVTMLLLCSCSSQAAYPEADLPSATSPPNVPDSPHTVYYSSLECKDEMCETSIWSVAAEGQPSPLWSLSSDWAEYGELTRGIQDFAISPDGNILAFSEAIRRHGTRLVESVTLRTVAKGSTDNKGHTQYGPNINVLNLAWSPDGNKVGFALSPELATTETAIGILDLTSDVAITVEFVSEFAWAPDSVQLIGSRTYSYNPDEKLGLYIISADDGTMTPLLLFERDSLTTAIHPAWSPNGREIAYVRNQRGQGGKLRASIEIVNPESSEAIVVIPELSGDSSVHWLAWSPDGRHLAYSDSEGLYSIDRVTLKRRMIFSGFAEGDWGSDSRTILLRPFTCPADISWVDIETQAIENLGIQGCGPSW